MTNELAKSTTQKIIDELPPQTEITSRIFGRIQKIISEASEEQRREIFKKEPDELIELERLKADLSMAHAEIEHLKKALEENAKEIKILYYEFKSHITIIEQLENQLKEARAETANLLKTMEEKLEKTDLYRKDFAGNKISFLIISESEWQKLKEKYK